MKLAFVKQWWMALIIFHINEYAELYWGCLSVCMCVCLNVWVFAMLETSAPTPPPLAPSTKKPGCTATTTMAAAKNSKMYNRNNNSWNTGRTLSTNNDTHETHIHTLNCECWIQTKTRKKFGWQAIIFARLEFTTSIFMRISVLPRTFLRALSVSFAFVPFVLFLVHNNTRISFLSRWKKIKHQLKQSTRLIHIISSLFRCFASELVWISRR